MSRWCHCAILVMGVALTGCDSHPLDGTDWPVRVDMKPVGRPADSSSDVTDTVAPTVGSGPLMLRQAMALAIAHNPGLSAYDTDIRATEARALQAGLWPNPELEAEVENFAGSGELSGIEAAETTVSLAQTFPLGGDVARRRDLADTRTALARWDYEAARLELLVEVTRRFVDAAAADRRLALAHRELDLARKTADVTARRVEAGDASSIERTRAEVPVIAAELAVKQADRRRDAAYRLLALTWGSRRNQFDQVQGDLDNVQPAPDPEMLVQRINQNPAVARWAAEISSRMAERQLAEAEATPDLTGRLGVKHDNGPDDVALVVGVSLPLPLFDRRQGDILATRLQEASARRRQYDAELQLEGLLNVVYPKLINARDQAVAMRDRALPAARESYEATRRAFDAGELPFLDVLDAQRTLFEFEHRYLDALIDYHTATAEIESLIGQRLADLSTPANPQGD